MIDPNCFDGGDKPCNNNFIWFAFFLILSLSMLALTVKGFVSLISDPCEKSVVIEEKS